MKFSMLIYSIMILSFFTLVCCSRVFPEKCEGRVLTILDKGQIIQIEAGKSFLLVLGNPGSGGYVVKDPPQVDSQILDFLKTERIEPKGSNMDGNFGEIVWTFQAKKAGESHIIVKASRPWERNKEPIVIFETLIQVTH